MDAEAGGPGWQGVPASPQHPHRSQVFPCWEGTSPPFPGPFPSRLLGVSEQNNPTNSSGDVSLVERLEA